MVRPKCCRRIARSSADAACIDNSGCRNVTNRQSPNGEVVLTLDEFEALRLADAMELYQDQAALQMDISRPTFSRIIQSARKKMALALINNQSIRIESGPVSVCRMKKFECRECHQHFEHPHGKHKPKHCPKCDSPSVQILGPAGSKPGKQCSKKKKCCKKIKQGHCRKNKTH